MQPFRVALMLAAVAMATAAAAQQGAPAVYKIGYVDTQRVLRDSRVSRQLEESLNAEFQKREKEIAAGPAVDIQRRGAALAEELNLRRDDELKQFITRTNEIIKRIAEREKFDIVFLEAAYASVRIDMTDAVIKALDTAR